MHLFRLPCLAAVLISCCLSSAAVAQALPPVAPPAPPAFITLAPISFDTSGPVLRAATDPAKPFTVAGERGFLVGRQNGSLEAWISPVKLLSHLSIEAEIEGYTIPIDVNRLAAAVEVRPDRTTITYSHAGFTVRQIMFSPESTAAGDAAHSHTGPIVLFEFDCLHPTKFTFRFTPNLEWMWPQHSQAHTGADWVSPDARNPSAAGGFYVIESDFPDLAGAVTIPGASPSTIPTYFDAAEALPVELHLRIDPARDHGRLFPLLMAVGTSRTSATAYALGKELQALNAQIPALYAAHEAGYKKLLASAVSIETPDPSLNEAFQWAVVSIEQLKAKIHDKTDGEETALVAGYAESGDAARPGFGWFFGRDALYTLYAIHGYGDFALAREELEFLIRRQRADGKIMHEYSQTAPAVEWQQFPYMWAAADSTPLFLLAMLDYARTSGDVDFLRTHRDALEKAWAFETDPAHDTDHDGIYDNSQGTGWVESWPGGLPHQEIYLALLDQQASVAMAQMEELLGDHAKAGAAQARAAAVAKTIQSEYTDTEKGCLAFSRNLNGTLDRTTNIYPALAWWSGLGSEATQPESCLPQFVASPLNTDWGTRDVANNEPIYDGMSYHQGSVWPLFTGWAALAEYRGGQPLAGYQLLKENANLTRAQDLGAVTEVLSGDFFTPYARSTPHQLWSSAMVITPTLRGLFGISIDAQSKTITVNPHLPADWNSAEIRNLPLPGGAETLHFNRQANHLLIDITDLAHSGWKLRSDIPGATVGQFAKVRKEIRPLLAKQLAIPLPQLAVFESPLSPPLPGERTSQPRVLSEESSEHRIRLQVEAPAGSIVTYQVTQPDRTMPHVEVGDGFSAQADATHPGVALSFVDTWEQSHGVPIRMELHFPPGTGWKTMTVTLTW